MDSSEEEGETLSNRNWNKIFLAVMILLGLFLAGSLFLLPDRSFSDRKKGDYGMRLEQGDAPKLSEIKGPRIDSGGVSIVREERAGKNIRAISPVGTKSCATLPVGTWVLLLATYLFLMIFNLGITFGKRNTIQWFWEATYTVLALASWFLWDGCRENLWFPLYVMALGVSIYLFYLYFFDRHLPSLHDEANEGQNRLF